MNGLITFFDIFISGVDGVEIEGRAAFLIDESLNCVLNFILRRFIFSVFFNIRVVFFLQFYDRDGFRGPGVDPNAK